MAKADMQIVLHAESQRDGWIRFRPGEMLQGTLTVFPDQNVRCKRLFVRLGWHTEGRGSTHKAEVNTQDLYEGELTAGLPRTFNFSFVLPYEPWSYQGHYISIVWELRAQMDVPWARDPVETINFILRP